MQNQGRISIRRMAESDISAVVACAKQSMLHPWSYQLFHDCLQKKYRQWLFYVDNTLVGFVILSWQQQECWLLNIAILPAWRGRGFGQWLLQRVQRFARLKHCDIILLEVRASNQAAIWLYEKLGFIVYATRKDYYPLNSYKREDALCMLCQLNTAN